jgi:rhomboid protease GluP
LHSLSIPYEIVVDDNRCMLIVPLQVLQKAKYELWQYDTENRQPRSLQPAVKPVYQNALPGVVAYVCIICLVAWLAGESAFNRDWFGAGRIDGALIRNGEWWRSITALTLHSGLGHLIGNIGFGILFGILAGTVAGPGVAWLTILLASTTGNFLNTLLLDSTHRAIGASTAVFAALGLVAGFSWRARLMSQERWPYRLGPIVGGIALLAYTGTGDENTDIGAHLSGFVCGFGAGMLLTHFADRLPGRKLQIGCGIAAAALVACAWLAAFGGWA